MPMPLSATVKRQRSPARSASTRTRGRTPGATNLTALPIRFWNSCTSCAGSPSTTGSSPHLISGGSPCASARSVPATSPTTRAVLTLSGGRSERPAREYASRSSIRVRMRAAPSTGVVDEGVGVRVELAVVAAAQQLQVARDHPQRLREVVRGDVGELRELRVGALELRRTLGHLALLTARLRHVAADRHAAQQPPVLVVQRDHLHPVGDRAVGRVYVEALRLAGERGAVAGRDR